MKIANIDRESLRIFWTSWGISMKFLDVTYDNFKSHKETGFHHLFSRCIFQNKTAGGGGLLTSRTCLFRVEEFSMSLWPISTRDFQTAYICKV